MSPIVSKNMRHKLEQFDKETIKQVVEEYEAKRQRARDTSPMYTPEEYLRWTTAQISEYTGLRSLFPKNYARYVALLNYGQNSPSLTIQDIKFLDEMSKLRSGNSDALSLLITSVDLDPDTDVTPLFEQYMHIITSPPKLDVTPYNYTPTGKLFNAPSVRYLQSTSALEAYASLAKQSVITSTSIDYPILVNARLFRDLGEHTRYAISIRQIFDVFLTFQSTSPKQMHSKTHLPTIFNESKHGKDLVGMQVIRMILLHYGRLPWATKHKRTRARSKLDFPCTLPNFMNVMLTISVYELTGVYTHELAVYAVKWMFAQLPGPFAQNVLENKKALSAIRELVGIWAAGARTLLREGDGRPFKTVSLDKWTEFNYSEKYAAYLALVEKFTPLEAEIFAYLQCLREGSGTKLTNSLILLFVILGCLTCTSTYNRTCPTLEYDNLAKPSAIQGLLPLKATSFVLGSDGYKYPLSYDNTNMPKYVRDMMNLFETEYEPELRDLARTFDMEKFHADSMTSRSQGPGQAAFMPQDLKGTALGKALNTRLIARGLDPEQLNNEFRCLVECAILGMAVLRFQIARKARGIAMATAVIQAAQIAVLKLYEFLKLYFPPVDTSEMAGNATSNAFLLEATNGLTNIVNSGDVNAMDRHTPPYISQVIEYLATKVFIDNSSSRGAYMWAKDCERPVMSHEATRVSKTSKYVSGLSYFMASIFSKSTNVGYAFTDTICPELPVRVEPGSVFSSGKFGTTAQHSILLGLGDEAMVRQFNASQPDSSRLGCLHKHLGDDISHIYSGTETLTNAFLKLMVQRYAEMNLKLELSVSKIMGTFLQQVAMFGLSAPQPHRMALFDDEHNVAINFSTVQKMGLIFEHIRTYGQRVVCNDNLRGLCSAIWNNHRMFTLKCERSDGLALNAKFDPRVVYYNPTTGNLRITIPYVAAAMDPLYMPIPALEGLVTVPAVGMAAPRSSMVWLLPLAACISKALVYSANPPVKSISPEFMEGYNFGYAARLLKYDFNEELSDLRLDETSHEHVAVIEQLYLKYVDQDELAKSRAAGLLLDTKGIFKHRGFSIEGETRRRVREAIARAEPMEREILKLDNKMLTKLKRMTNTFPREYGEIINAHVCWPTFDDTTTLTFHKDAVASYGLPLLPAYALGSFAAAYNIFGSSSSGGSEGYSMKLSKEGRASDSKRKYMVINEGRKLRGKLLAQGIQHPEFIIADLFGIKKRELASFITELRSRGGGNDFSNYESSIIFSRAYDVGDGISPAIANVIPLNAESSIVVNKNGVVVRDVLLCVAGCALSFMHKVIVQFASYSLVQRRLLDVLPRNMPRRDHEAVQ